MDINVIKNTFFNIIDFLLIVFVVIPIVFGMGLKWKLETNGLENFFSEWQNEVDPEVAIIVSNLDQFIIGGEDVDVDGMLLKYSMYPDGATFLCVDKRELHFTKRIDGGLYALCSLNIDTGDLRKIYTISSEQRNIYTQDYYVDRNIYLETIDYWVVYNLDSGTLEKLDKDSVSVPEPLYKIEVLEEESKYCTNPLKITGNGVTRTLTLDYMAEIDENAKKLTTLEPRIRPFGIGELLGNHYPVSELFDFGATVIGDKIYVCGIVEDYDMDLDSNLVVFSYDPLSEELDFVYNDYVFVIPLVTVIPVE